MGGVGGWGGGWEGGVGGGGWGAGGGGVHLVFCVVAFWLVVTAILVCVCVSLRECQQRQLGECQHLNAFAAALIQTHVSKHMSVSDWCRRLRTDMEPAERAPAFPKVSP